VCVSDKNHSIIELETSTAVENFCQEKERVNGIPEIPGENIETYEFIPN
jgi:hypothetical protein